jgi:hypothetical protein
MDKTERAHIRLNGTMPQKSGAKFFEVRTFVVRGLAHPFASQPQLKATVLVH